MKLSKLLLVPYAWFNRIFDALIPVGDLIVRMTVAYHFLNSAFTKLQSWQTTLLLFEYEYRVPFLSTVMAAYLGTFVELVFPILLLIGLGGRIPAFVLFIFNLTAVYSYQHFLLSEAGREGLEDHFYWGILIMISLLHGTGKLSLDYPLKKIFRWVKFRR